MAGGQLQVADPLHLIAGATAIAITEDLAQRLELSEGDSFPAQAGFGEVELVVRGILYGSGIAQAYGGQVAARAFDILRLQKYSIFLYLAACSPSGSVISPSAMDGGKTILRVPSLFHWRTAATAEVAGSMS